MVLMRDALSSYSSHLVPQVYDWCSSSSSNANSILGYVLQEHKLGPGLDGTFGLGRQYQPKFIFEGTPRREEA